MPNFTPYDPALHTPSQFAQALLSPNSGILVDVGSIQLKYGKTEYRVGGNVSSIAFYDGELAALGIGAGIFLSSGDGAPPLTNTRTSYGLSLAPSHTDASLDVAVHAAFPSAGQVRDASVLEFKFQIQQGAAIQFDLVFGSDEYPEFSNTSYVDIAGVFVNGVNYAYFNNKANQPLSILQQNLVAGNFRDNSAKTLPLEYDGISKKLTIVAPVQAGVNTLKIAIADTGDQIYDSGIFVANLRAVAYQGAGLALLQQGTQGKDLVQGADFNEFFDLGAGDDILILGKGDDVVSGGMGMDAIAFYGAFLTSMLVPAAGGYKLMLPDGSVKYLNGVELLYATDSGLFALDTQPGGNAWFVYALVNALTNAAPSKAMLSEWLDKSYEIGDFAAVAQAMLDAYAPSAPLTAVIAMLFQNLVGAAASEEQIAQIAALVGPGKTFANVGQLVAAAAQLELNTQEIASIVGKPLPLDVSYFV
ncbi:MAG: choice-of-anchor L domain-containing protein [Rhodocyclaceae bacterium]|nr:choice-of-anchor L domain-containing protein [Rhodocyclaceae bacterium]